MSKKLFITFIENLPAIATICLAIYSVSPGTITANEAYGWILVLLALLATTTIIDKFRYSTKITQIYSFLETNFQQELPADRFFHKGIPDIKEKLQYAEELDICGVTLNRSVREYLDVFEKKLNDGCKIRIMMIDPQSIAPQHAEAKSYVTDAEAYHNKIATTIGFLKNLNKKKHSGTLLVKLLPFDPSFGMTIINGNDINGFLACEIYQHISIDPSPAFLLNAKVDKYWFGFFKDQYQKMWDKANTLDLT